MPQTTDPDTTQNRYARAHNALEHFPDGYLMYLKIAVDEKREDEGLTEDEELMVDIWHNEWGGCDPQTGREFATWLTYKQYETHFPTVENDPTRHLKCIGCGSNKYAYHDHKQCGCPVGFRERTWYDCLDCDEEYVDEQTPENVPLCRECFKRHLDRAQRLAQRE